MYILGINAYHGDASATLIKDGEIVLAIEEERLNRSKHWAGFPLRSIKTCLDEGGISIEEVDHIGISTDPSANLRHKVLYSLSRFTKIHKMLRDRISKVGKTRDIKGILTDGLNVNRDDIGAQIHNVEHHLAHMASAFFVSPFEEAAIITLDGMGDFVSTKWGTGKGIEISTMGQVQYPHSLGYLYTALTQFLGFPYYGDEGKVMGLAPYGNPDPWMEIFEDMVRIPGKHIGFELNLEYFNHHEKGIDMQWEDGQPTVGTLYSHKMVEKLGEPREPGSEYTERVQNIAAALQKRFEQVALAMVDRLAHQTGKNKLCIAGGVALNSVMNGKILPNTSFEDVYIHPNAGDGGTSLGAAYYIWNVLEQQERPASLPHAYLGLEFSDEEIGKVV